MNDALDEILGRRASGDALPIDVDPVTMQLAVFEIGDRLFAFPGEQVAEILPPPTIYFVPGCPPALEGVIDVRGEIWSVLCLGDLVGVAHGSDPAVHPAAAPPRGRGRPALLLGRTATMQSALRVDAALDVLDCPRDSIRPAPDTLPDPLQSLATGVFAHGGRSVVVLDMERLFAVWREARE
jgi:purine-binding chemotaxis protein CheW